MPFNSYQVLNHLLSNSHEAQRVKIEEPISEGPDLLESIEQSLKNEIVEGKWTEQENIKFAIFVHYHQNIFSSKQKRKVCKVFKLFTEFLEGRSASQCRSHYQKIMLKYKTISRLKKNFKALLGGETYKKAFQEFKEMWEQNHAPLVQKHPQIKQSKEISIQTDEIPPFTCQNCKNTSPKPQTESSISDLSQCFLMNNSQAAQWSNSLMYCWYPINYAMGASEERQ